MKSGLVNKNYSYGVASKPPPIDSGSDIHDQVLLEYNSGLLVPIEHDWGNSRFTVNKCIDNNIRVSWGISLINVEGSRSKLWSGYNIFKLISLEIKERWTEVL